MMRKKLRLIVSVALALCLMMSMSAAAYADFSASYTTNQNVSKTEVFRTQSNITKATLSYGELPTGFSLSKDDHSIYLSGSTTKTGDFECGIWIETDGGLEVSIIKLKITNGTDEFVPESTSKPSTSIDPVDDGKPPKITKHPTGETVEPGGSAKFIARADNATEFVWRIVSKDTTNTITAKEAPSYFSGLKVSGTDSETLVLSNIPSSMNGWSVECKFKNANGTSFTNGAVITVKSSQPVVTTPKPTAKNPVINTQPVDEKRDLGNPCTLSVKAISPDSGTLYYQWYKSTNGSTTGMTAIKDANDPSYTPPETEGTTYYCVAISNAKNGGESPAIYSNMVSVTYTNPTVPMQSETPSGGSSGQPSGGSSNQPSGGSSNQSSGGIEGHQSPGTTAAPTAAPADSSSSRDNGNSLRTSLIFFGATGVLALAALIGILVYLLKSNRDDR